MRLDQAIFVGVAKVSAEAAMSPDRHGILQAGIVIHRKAHVVCCVVAESYLGFL